MSDNCNSTTKREPVRRIFNLLLIVQSLIMPDSLQPHGLQYSKLSLSFTISQSLVKLMSIEVVMPSNHLIFCSPLLFLPSVFPRIRVFPMSQLLALGD